MKSRNVLTPRGESRNNVRVGASVDPRETTGMMHRRSRTLLACFRLQKKETTSMFRVTPLVFGMRERWSAVQVIAPSKPPVFMKSLKVRWGQRLRPVISEFSPPLIRVIATLQTNDETVVRSVRSTPVTDARPGYEEFECRAAHNLRPRSSQ